MEPTPQLNDYVNSLNLYVEISTSRLYEGKLFEDFVLLRPVLPQFHDGIKKVPLEEFGKEFDDYQGDRSTIGKFLKSYIPARVTLQ